MSDFPLTADQVAEVVRQMEATDYAARRDALKRDPVKFEDVKLMEETIAPPFTGTPEEFAAMLAELDDHLNVEAD